jgi:hypothetical protein
VPVTDITIKNDNLIAATQGRSFWLIDDITPLHQLTEEVAKSTVHLYKPMPSYRINGGDGTSPKGPSKTVGRNHPGGVIIHFLVKDTANVKVSLEIMDANGTLIKKFATKPDKKAKEEELKVKPGMNKFNWNMRYADAEGFDGLIMWAGSLTGPKAMPGIYKAKLSANGESREVEFEIVKDPRTTGSLADIKEQFDFAISVRDKLSETNKAVKKIRTAREQINRVIEPMKGKDEYKDVNDMAKTILDEMKAAEEALYQTKNKSGQDPLNYPIRLNNKLAALGGEVDGSDYKPTQQVKEVQTEINGMIDEQLKAVDKIFKEKLPRLNDLVKKKEVSAIEIM